MVISFDTYIPIFISLRLNNSSINSDKEIHTHKQKNPSILIYKICISWAVRKILHEELGLHKLSSRWIPYLLTEDQKKARVDWCKLMLVKFDMGKSNKVSQIITGDETWIYSY